jgi:Leu/Phe-tRNA-protein transferase
MPPDPKNILSNDEEPENGSTVPASTNRRQRPVENTAKRRQRSKPGGRVHYPEIYNYIPDYLRQFVKPSHGDFCFSPIFHPVLIGQLMIEGFLPIAGPDYLLPKLHEQRCVIDLSNHGSGLHISKSVKKKAGRFQLTINKAFDDVVAGCRTQHGATCWLYPPLVSAFKIIHEQSKVDTSSSFRTNVISDDNDDDETDSTPRLCHLRFYSIEVWNKETGQLAGGELGYSVGSIYTSLTGFSAEDSAGSVQLAALGSLLHHQNFILWDLGMEMDYKKKLGSTLMCRDDFVDKVHFVREQFGHMCLNLRNSAGDSMNCRDIIAEARGEISDTM